VNCTFRSTLAVSLISLLLPAAVSAENGSRRYKEDCSNDICSKDFIDPLSLPAAIADTVSGIFAIGGTVVTSSAPEKYKMYGWIAIVAGSATEGLVKSIDGRAEIRISLNNGESSQSIPLASALDSIEADALFIGRGLGQVDVVTDIAAAAKMSPLELAIAINSARGLADSLTGETRIASTRIVLRQSDFANGLRSLNLKQQEAAANYLALRNIQVSI
jgi:hypothetical protein